MPCAKMPSTQAYLDGEVDGADAAASERHIADCPECQAFCADAADLSDAIRTTVPRYAAPAQLKLRIRQALAAEDHARSAPPVAARRAIRRSFWRGTLSGAGAMALAASLAAVAILPPSADSLADQVMDAHTRALMRGPLIQVASSDHHTVKPWFAGRIALSPPVKDLADQGFKLAGGRLDKVAGAPAAVLVYQHGRHRLDLFVWADRGSSLPTTVVRHGYRAMYWKSGDLDFAAVSDVAAPELASFVQLVRAEPE